MLSDSFLAPSQLPKSVQTAKGTGAVVSAEDAVKSWFEEQRGKATPSMSVPQSPGVPWVIVGIAAGSLALITVVSMLRKK